MRLLSSHRASLPFSILSIIVITLVLRPAYAGVTDPPVTPAASSSPASAAADADAKPSGPPLRKTAPPLLTLHLPPTAALPNPQSLPARTFATLLSHNHSASATFTTKSTFLFRSDDVPVGEYLCEVWTNAWSFVPMRVDVSSVAREGGGAGGADDVGKKVEVWQTFRGNEWGNKGERLGSGDEKEGCRVDIGVIGQKQFYEEKRGFSPMALLKNPMILIGIFGLGMMVVLPKMLDSMDPEMRKEFEERQRDNPITGGMNSGNPLGGFDMAAWMAGSSPDKKAKTSGSEPGGGGGKTRRRG